MANYHHGSSAPDQVPKVVLNHDILENEIVLMTIVKTEQMISRFLHEVSEASQRAKHEPCQTGGRIRDCRLVRRRLLYIPSPHLSSTIKATGDQPPQAPTRETPSAFPGASRPPQREWYLQSPVPRKKGNLDPPLVHTSSQCEASLRKRPDQEMPAGPRQHETAPQGLETRITTDLKIHKDLPISLMSTLQNSFKKHWSSCRTLSWRPHTAPSFSRKKRAPERQ